MRNLASYLLILIGFLLVPAADELCPSNFGFFLTVIIGLALMVLGVLVSPKGLACIGVEGGTEIEIDEIEADFDIFDDEL